eukprot:485817-Rhodomonas_salina.1
MAANLLPERRTQRGVRRREGLRQLGAACPSDVDARRPVPLGHGRPQRRTRHRHFPPPHAIPGAQHRDQHVDQRLEHSVGEGDEGREVRDIHAVVASIEQQLQHMLDGGVWVGAFGAVLERGCSGVLPLRELRERVELFPSSVELALEPRENVVGEERRERVLDRLDVLRQVVEDVLVRDQQREHAEVARVPALCLLEDADEQLDVFLEKVWAHLLHRLVQHGRCLRLRPAAHDMSTSMCMQSDQNNHTDAQPLTTMHSTAVHTKIKMKDKEEGEESVGSAHMGWSLTGKMSSSGSWSSELTVRLTTHHSLYWFCLISPLISCIIAPNAFTSLSLNPSNTNPTVTFKFAVSNATSASFRTASSLPGAAPIAALAHSSSRFRL